MQINAFCDYVCLADVRNFKTAAEMQGVTISGLSRRMKSLEDYVGSQLIDRSKSPIELTPAGEKMLDLSVELLQYLKDAEDNTDLNFLATRFRSQFMTKFVSGSHLPRRFPQNIPPATANVPYPTHGTDPQSPTIAISKFRNLSNTQTSNELSENVTASLRAYLGQSYFLRCVSEMNSIPQTDFLVEGTIAEDEFKTKITLSLVDRNTESILISTSKVLQERETIGSVENISREFTWNIVSAIRGIYFTLAKKLKPAERTQYMNIVFAHESIMAQFMTDFDAVESACTALEESSCSPHIVCYLRGLAALRRWVRDVDALYFLDTAEDSFETALETNAQFPPAILGLAIVNCYRRRFNDAQILYERWLSAPGRSAIAVLTEGIINLALGQYPKAIALLKTAEKFEAKALLLSPIYSSLALYSQEKYGDAVARISLRRSPFPDAVAIKLAARAKAFGKDQISALKAGRNLLPSSLSDFRLERYPLADEAAQDRLLAGLDMAGVKVINRM